MTRVFLHSGIGIKLGGWEGSQSFGVVDSIGTRYVGSGQNALSAQHKPEAWQKPGKRVDKANEAFGVWVWHDVRALCLLVCAHCRSQTFVRGLKHEASRKLY